MINTCNCYQLYIDINEISMLALSYFDLLIQVCGTRFFIAKTLLESHHIYRHEEPFSRSENAFRH